MTLQARFRIGQRVRYRANEKADWRDAKIVAFSPGGNYVHVGDDVNTGAMAVSESQARKCLLAAGEDPILVQLTAKQRDLFDRVFDGTFYIGGHDVVAARKLEKLGLVKLEDNGFMAQDRAGHSDGERWSVELVRRIDQYQSAAKHCGTMFVRADPEIRSNIAGAITKHPVARQVAESLAKKCRDAGGEAKLVDEDRDQPEGRAFVYLSGCSFNTKENL